MASGLWTIRCHHSPVDIKDGAKRLIQVVVELFAIVRKDDMRKAHKYEQLNGR